MSAPRVRQVPKEQAEYEARVDAYYKQKRMTAIESYVLIRWTVPLRPWLSHARRQTILVKEGGWIVTKRRLADGHLAELRRRYPEGVFYLDELPANQVKWAKATQVTNMG